MIKRFISVHPITYAHYSIVNFRFDIPGHRVINYCCYQKRFSSSLNVSVLNYFQIILCAIFPFCRLKYTFFFCFLDFVCFNLRPLLILLSLVAEISLISIFCEYSSSPWTFASKQFSMLVSPLSPSFLDT